MHGKRILDVADEISRHFQDKKYWQFKIMKKSVCEEDFPINEVCLKRVAGYLLRASWTIIFICKCFQMSAKIDRDKLNSFKLT